MQPKERREEHREKGPDSGYGRVDVSPTSVQVQFVAQGGARLYGYTVD